MTNLMDTYMTRLERVYVSVTLLVTWLPLFYYNFCLSYPSFRISHRKFNKINEQCKL